MAQQFSLARVPPKPYSFTKSGLADHGGWVSFVRSRKLNSLQISKSDLAAFMVVENFPELASLDAEQRLILAGEFWKSATSPDGDSKNLSEGAIQMLEERLAHYEAHPETGIAWEKLRDAKLAQ